MRLRSIGLAVVVNALVALPFAVQGQGLPPGAAERGHREATYSCMPQDENGRSLANPNVPFICDQVDAFRKDCEMQMKMGNTLAMGSHCFGWEPQHVRGGMPATTQQAAKAPPTSAKAPPRSAKAPPAPRSAYASGRPERHRRR
ncbi:hypothetical protein OPKNFCMD_6029 [Methylobacterium crusticola]|uniref:DUF3551 domain-containing protein n=1 Tax=Methylobacterium crusticola TaxID=1697972 RepID=A0ABQ4R900_9HYPH|nr:hypothetical protein [Methylobacterium crusticola]GJD53256.1 hypothetical protein OPKNFCMD_6029 [Methylobacterium crusticola]